MICFPNAKINLGLTIKGKRPDNMHNIETCLLPIPLYDILEIKNADSFTINLMGLDLDGKVRDNIIVKAWNKLLSVSNKIQPVGVFLYKNIPAGSGLGGGSSDAAFFIRAINKYFSLGFSNDYMENIALEVGSDCPFFIKNKPVIATETGSVFKEIGNPISNKYLTVVFPNFCISTVAAYSKVVPGSNQSLDTIVHCEASTWKRKIKNDFEDNIFIDFPELFDIKRTLYENGAEYASLTGTGSAIYAISLSPLNIPGIRNKYKTWSTFIQ